MTKKKSSTGRRRKKSNTTTQNTGAKRSKTEEKNSAEYRNGILHGIRALLGKLEDKALVAVMAYVSTMEEEQKPTAALQSSMTVTATATEEATATATGTGAIVLNTTAEASNFTTTEGNPSGAQTTAEAANPTTPAVTEIANPPLTTATVPPSPEDPVIRLNKNTRVSPHNIVTIDPRCFHCDDSITEVAATKRKNKSINTI